MQRDADLVKNRAIEKALADLEILENLLLNKNSLKSFAQADLLVPSDLAHKVLLIPQIIQQLKEDLLKIYDLNE